MKNGKRAATSRVSIKKTGSSNPRTAETILWIMAKEMKKQRRTRAIAVFFLSRGHIS